MSTTSSSAWSSAFTALHSTAWSTDPAGLYSTYSTDPSTTDILNTTGKQAIYGNFFRSDRFLSYRDFLRVLNGGVCIHEIFFYLT